jgi:sulfite reductase beta subunit-like hemoprotein
MRGIANRTVSAVAHAPLGDLTVFQLRALADIQRDFDADVRVTNRQNLALRGLAEADLRGVYGRLADAGMAQPGAELSRDVVACPGADTCNLGLTQSRGLAEAIGQALDEAGLAEVGGVRVNISGCSNSCGQHHVADIGLFGTERRAHGRSAPGYQMLLGGRLGDMQVHFGEKATKLPAKRTAEAVVLLVGRFAAERAAGETFAGWLARSGGAARVGAGLADLAEIPEPEAAPDLYVDFGETGPYVAEIGESECAS